MQPTFLSILPSAVLKKIIAVGNKIQLVLGQQPIHRVEVVQPGRVVAQKNELRRKFFLSQSSFLFTRGLI